MRKGFWSLLVGIAMFSEGALARGPGSGLVFTLNAFMEKATLESQGASSDIQRLHYDLKFGKTYGNGLYLGALYFSERESSGGATSEGSGYGPSLGYMGSSGLFIQGHYIWGAKFGEYTEGQGVQVDLGYLTDVTPAVVVGVELRYRSLEYKEYGGVKMDGYKITRTLPMLTLGFLF